MGKYFLVGWLPGLNVWFARQRGGYYITNESLHVVLDEVRRCRLPIMIDRDLAASEVLKITGAATFLGVTVVNEQGAIVRPTPVVEGKVRYITRDELGALIPDGWMIECQLNTYAACFGEELAFPARKQLALAIADIRSFLAQSIVQNSSDLAASIAAEPTLEQAVMDLGLVSSDSRGSGAMDKVHRA